MRPPAGAPQFRAPAPQQHAQPHVYPPSQPYPPGTASPSLAGAYAPTSAPGPAPAYAAVPVRPDALSPAPWLSGPPQRPAVIALGCSLAVVGSLLWICSLSLLWVTAVIGTGTFAQIGDNGAVFHILNRFNDRMLDGLAIPLYLFPLASFTTGFLVLSPRPWARTLHTAVGLVALVWAAWWLWADLLWWFSAAWYVVVACLVLWTPAATAWYRWREPEPTAAAGS